MSEAPRTYKVFAHVTGLVLFEIAFWSGVLAVGVLLRKVAARPALRSVAALVVPPVGLVLFAVHYRWKQQRMTEAADAELSHSCGRMPVPGVPSGNSLWRTALALLAIGMLDPKSVAHGGNGIEGVDIMIALDVSRSMLAEDVGMAVDLLSAASNAWSSNSMDRVGLIVFAGEAYVQAPLTQDWLPSSCFSTPWHRNDPTKLRRSFALALAELI